MADPILAPQDVDDFIIIRAVAFSNRIQGMMLRDVLRKEDMPLLEWRLIFSLARFGDCHLARITERTSLDPAHASRAAAALERKGLISRHPDPKDNRRRLLRLTPSGLRVFDRIWPQARDLIRGVTDQLTRAEFSDLKRLMDRVNEITAPAMMAASAPKETRPAA